MDKQVLFVSHYAGRTGAPIVLLNHLAGLKKNYPDFEFDILLKKDGEKKGEFENVAKTWLLPKITLSLRVKNKLSKPLNYYSNFLKSILKNNYKVIYGNTVDTISVLITAKTLDADLITVCHLHELEMAIKQFYGDENFKNAIPFIDRFVATSGAVKEYLIDHYKIAPGKIYVHHGHIPLPGNIERKNIDNRFRVFGSGTMDWRKGIDLFIQAAYLLDKLNPATEFEFCWIGGQKDSLDYEKVVYDIKMFGIQHRVKLIPNCPNPWDYLVEADLFLLTSREDPFPLICLEAAALGKPMMCFKKAGGMADFVNEENGWLIDYLDVPQLADTLNGILHADNLKQILKVKGELSQVKAFEYDIEKGVKKWKSYLDEICSI
jgi:glycosyltransferase involved in cell wall biosynthesis